jgi:acyl carrier protein
MDNLESKIKEFIVRNLLYSGNSYKYSDDASFLEEGIVDSQGVMELVLFVEDSLGVSVDDLEITPDNFDSVNKLTAFVRRKKGLIVNVKSA